MMIQNNKPIERDKSYTFFQLADRTGLRVAEVQDLVQRGKLPAHITDETQVVNGKDFIQFMERENMHHKQFDGYAH